MGKIITLYGPDGSGKTTLAYALADRLAGPDHLVLIVHTDFTRPVLQEHSPNKQDALSLGQLLMTGDMDSLDRATVPYKENNAVFIAGIQGGETYASYPDYPPEAARAFLRAASAAFDAVILDTTDNVRDGLALAGLDQCGHVAYLIPPNIQGIIFANAYAGLLESFHAKEKSVYIAAEVRPFSNPHLVEHTLGIRYAVQLPLSPEADYLNLSGAPIRHCRKKDGIRYEQAVELIRQQIG